MANEIFYSTVFHQARKRMGISLSEYCLTDYIFKWQSNPSAPRPGWCSKPRSEMAAFVGISVRGIQKMLDRLDSMDLVVLDPVSREVRATRAWFDNVVAENERLARPMKIGSAPAPSPSIQTIEVDEQSSGVENGGGEQSSWVGVNKVHGGGEQSSGEGVNKVHTTKEVIKKGSKKGSKELAGKTPPFIHQMVEVFEKNHKLHFTTDGKWDGFEWADKDFTGLVGLKKKLLKRYEAKMERTPDDSELLASFDKWLQTIVETDEWFLKVFTPATLNGQFQNSINRIHNGTNANGKNAKPGNTNTRVNSSEFFSGYGAKN